MVTRVRKQIHEEITGFRRRIAAGGRAPGLVPWQEAAPYWRGRLPIDRAVLAGLGSGGDEELDVEGRVVRAGGVCIASVERRSEEKGGWCGCV